MEGSTSKNYIEQTEVIIKALEERAFKDLEMPEEYAEAIKEFNEQEERLTRLMSKDWVAAASSGRNGCGRCCSRQSARRRPP